MCNELRGGEFCVYQQLIEVEEDARVVSCVQVLGDEAEAQ